MANYKPKIVNETNVAFGPVRLSYASVFAPKKFDGDAGEGKYMTHLLIPKDDTETVDALRQAIAAAKEKGRLTKWKNRIPANYRDPLMDGDKTEKPETQGHWYINAKSDRQPDIVDMNRKKITDPEEVYSGCWCYAYVGFFPYAAAGGNGVGASLYCLQKQRDDEHFGSSVSAAAIFADTPDPDFDPEDI